MTWLIIFVTLFAVQYACGDSETTQTASFDSIVFLRAETTTAVDIVQCTIKNNDGPPFRYAPGVGTIPGVLDSRIVAYDKRSCSVKIAPVTLNDGGLWEIVSRSQEGESHSFKSLVYVKVDTKTAPSGKITVQEGLYAYAQIKEPLDKIKSCKVNSPAEEKIDLLSTSNEDIRVFGKCGMRIIAKPKHTGVWTFTATTEDNVIYTADTYFQVLSTENHRPAIEETESFLLTRGERGSVRVGSSSIKFCQLKNPQGEKLPMIDGACNYEIPVVTAHHEGIWTAEYGTIGKLDTDTLRFRILTRDAETIIGNVSYLDNGVTRVSCSVQHREARPFAFCRFTRPDGIVMNASPGIGTKRYSALEVSELDSKENELHCALTIHQPEKVDFGPWKCEISSGRGAGHTGVVLRVNGAFRTHLPTEFRRTDLVPVTVRASDVYVKQNDSFAVKCTADTALDYCWLRSPNGTAYSVSSAPKQRSSKPFVLPYEGAGLGLGECGARINAANRSDHGEWSCHVGVADGREVNQTFRVIVTSGYLIANSSKVMVNNGGNATVSCKILPGDENRAIHYCRWIRPNGYGIYNGDGHRYTTSSCKCSCKLVIQKYNPMEDLGVWKCIAGVHGPVEEELQVDVEVGHYREGISASFTSSLMPSLTIAGCVLLIVTVCLLIVMNLHRRSVPKHPPAYSAESCTPPKSLNPSFFPKKFQY